MAKVRLDYGHPPRLYHDPKAFEKWLEQFKPKDEAGPETTRKPKKGKS